MDTLLSYLPQHAGLLPKWMLLVSLISVGNSIQSYTTLYYTRRIYNIDPTSPLKPTIASTPKSSTAYPTPHSPLVTSLSARTFGTWTFLTSVVRLFAAYNIDHPAFYGLAFCTYLVAFAHFASEWLVFGTAEWGAPLAGPVIVSTSTIVWMVSQWGYYVAM